MWPVREPSPISRLISHVSSLLKHISCLSSPASSYFSCLPSLVSSLLSPNFSSPVSRLSILRILSSSLTLLQHPLPLKPLADGNGGGSRLTTWRAEWSDFLFLQFLKVGTLLSIGYIFMSSIPKKSAIFVTPSLWTRRKVFISKNHRDLKNEYLFWKICKCLPFTSKNNRQKENLGNNFLKYFNLGPQIGQNLVSLNF